jgi:hypothetical protein
VCWRYSMLMSPSMKGCEALSVQILRANSGKTFDFLLFPGSCGWAGQLWPARQASSGSDHVALRHPGITREGFGRVIAPGYEAGFPPTASSPCAVRAVRRHWANTGGDLASCGREGPRRRHGRHPALMADPSPALQLVKVQRLTIMPTRHDQPRAAIQGPLNTVEKCCRHKMYVLAGPPWVHLKNDGTRILQVVIEDLGCPS